MAELRESDLTPAHVPERLRPLIRWMTSRWIGRATGHRNRIPTAGDLRPGHGAWCQALHLRRPDPDHDVGLDRELGESTRFAEAIDMPPAAEQSSIRRLTNPAAPRSGSAGSLFVIISATSLSRALTRAIATIWWLPRPKTRLSNVLAVGDCRHRAGPVHPCREIARSIHRRDPAAHYLDPGDRLRPRLPHHRLCAVAAPRRQVQDADWCPAESSSRWPLLVIRPAADTFLPRALAESADKYGTIGVAFTYLAWLYIVALTYLDRHRRTRPRRRRRPARPVHPPRRTNSVRTIPRVGCGGGAAWVVRAGSTGVGRTRVGGTGLAAAGTGCAGSVPGPAIL